MDVGYTSQESQPLDGRDQAPLFFGGAGDDTHVARSVYPRCVANASAAWKHNDCNDTPRRRFTPHGLLDPRRALAVHRVVRVVPSYAWRRKGRRSPSKTTITRVILARATAPAAARSGPRVGERRRRPASVVEAQLARLEHGIGIVVGMLRRVLSAGEWAAD